MRTELSGWGYQLLLIKRSISRVKLIFDPPDSNRVNLVRPLPSLANLICTPLLSTIKFSLTPLKLIFTPSQPVVVGVSETVVATPGDIKKLSKAQEGLERSASLPDRVLKIKHRLTTDNTLGRLQIRMYRDSVLEMTAHRYRGHQAIQASHSDPKENLTTCTMPRSVVLGRFSPPDHFDG